MIQAGSVCTGMACNVEFAPTVLDIAGLPRPSWMLGRSLVPLLRGETPGDGTDVAYHRFRQNQDEIHNTCARCGIRTNGRDGGHATR